jgi:hypothetical protein
MRVARVRFHTVSAQAGQPSARLVGRGELHVDSDGVGVIGRRTVSERVPFVLAWVVGVLAFFGIIWATLGASGDVIALLGCLAIVAGIGAYYLAVWALPGGVVRLRIPWRVIVVQCVAGTRYDLDAVTVGGRFSVSPRDEESARVLAAAFLQEGQRGAAVSSDDDEGSASTLSDGSGESERG